MTGKTQVTAPTGLPYIETERSFDAPRELLLRAYTEPDLVARWLGPRRMTMTIDTYDVRDGGRWRYIHRDDDGNEFAFRGVFHGDPTPDGLTQTFEFEAWPGHVALDALTFEEHDGRTTVRTHSVYQTVADRDAMVDGGMETGYSEGMDRLEELITSLTPSAIR